MHEYTNFNSTTTGHLPAVHKNLFLRDGRFEDYPPEVEERCGIFWYIMIWPHREHVLDQGSGFCALKKIKWYPNRTVNSKMFVHIENLVYMSNFGPKALVRMHSRI